MAGVYCYQCQAELNFEQGQKVGKHDDCEKCHASLHCCKMCKFYDPKAYNECHEPNAERIVEKEKANYCDYFILKGDQNNVDNKNTLVDAANALFKN